MTGQESTLSELEIRSLAQGLRQFADEYKHLVTLKALGHLGSAITVLESVAPLGHRQLSNKPQPRICGLCPCEMSDLLKDGVAERG